MQNPGDEEITGKLPLWLRSTYRGALTVYGIYLGYTKIGFPYDPLGWELPSFLFKLDDIFESFVRNSLRANCRADKISVLDGNRPNNQVSLFVDSHRYPVKPDIILRREKEVVVVAEVKYKPRIEEADRYQLISHTLAASAARGIWISPVLAGEPAGLAYVGSTGGAKFYHYTLDIGSTNLADSEKQMASDIVALFAAHSHS